MKCAKCGAELQQDAVFCVQCGEKISVANEVSNPAMPEKPPVVNNAANTNPVFNQAFAPVAGEAVAEAENKKKKAKIFRWILIGIAVLFLIFAVITSKSSKPVPYTSYTDYSQIDDYVAVNVQYVDTLATEDTIDSETKEVKSTQRVFCFAITDDNYVCILDVSKTVYDEQLSHLEDNLYSSDSVTVYANVKELNKKLIDLYPDVLTDDTVDTLNNQELKVIPSAKENMNGTLMLITFLLLVSFFVVLFLRKKFK